MLGSSLAIKLNQSPEAGSICQQPTKAGHTDMHEIICPHCGKAFKIDEAGYADILKQGKRVVNPP